MLDIPNSQKWYLPKTSPFPNEVHSVLGLKHMSRRTEASYVYYILSFIHFYGKRHITQGFGGLGVSFCSQCADPLLPA